MSIRLAALPASCQECPNRCGCGKPGTESPASIEPKASAGAKPDDAPGFHALALVALGIEPTEDQIRIRAYQIFLERGGVPGDPAEDWERAKHDLGAA